jgi:hypothetical protein
MTPPYKFSLHNFPDDVVKNLLHIDLMQLFSVEQDLVRIVGSCQEMWNLQLLCFMWFAPPFESHRVLAEKMEGTCHSDRRQNSTCGIL